MPESVWRHLAERRAARITAAVLTWWVCLYTTRWMRTCGPTGNNYSLSIGVGKGVVPVAKRIETLWSFRQAQGCHDDAVARTCDSDQSSQYRRKHLARGERADVSPRGPGRLPGTVSTPGAEGPTAHLLPQFSWPQQPQQSSSSSPMNTNAGRNIWFENRQTKVTASPPNQSLW